ncbi:hypothetical protein E4U61_005957 [Claviceps capensis]|nr:hypothetical protein E4U61_005957 [Claviceps capensis]
MSIGFAAATLFGPHLQHPRRQNLASKPTETDQSLANMGSPAREADLMTRKGDINESMCPMVLLPPEMKIQIISYITL